MLRAANPVPTKVSEKQNVVHILVFSNNSQTITIQLKDTRLMVVCFRRLQDIGASIRGQKMGWMMLSIVLD